jgi:hypothetical protein
MSAIEIIAFPVSGFYHPPYATKRPLIQDEAHPLFMTGKIDGLNQGRIESIEGLQPGLRLMSD